MIKSYCLKFSNNLIKCYVNKRKLVSIYTEVFKLSIIREETTQLKMDKISKWLVFKVDMKMPHKHMKSCPMSLVRREMQIKLQ